MNSLFELLQDLPVRLARMDRKLNVILRAIQRGGHMAQADIDALKAQVERNTSVTGSAATLIKGLIEQLKAAADDPAEIQALTAQLSTSADALSAAVASNTPATTTPPAAAATA